MTKESLYAAPKAILVEDSDGYYQPRVLSLSGRLDRSRLFSYGAVAFIINYLLLFGSVSLIANSPAGHAAYVNIADFLSVLLLAVCLLLGKRRLNDANVGGWWILLLFVPIGNIIFILYVMAKPGSPGVNNYGAAPFAGNAALSLALVMLAFAVNIGLHFMRPAVFEYY